jgi:hypothetical protein
VKGAQAFRRIYSTENGQAEGDNHTTHHMNIFTGIFACGAIDGHEIRFIANPQCQTHNPGTGPQGIFRRYAAQDRLSISVEGRENHGT